MNCKFCNDRYSTGNFCSNCGYPIKPLEDLDKHLWILKIFNLGLSRQKCNELWEIKDKQERARLLAETFL